jgi:hypothetical protein
MDSKELNSCLMLAVNLDCPISLKAMFDTPDLKDTGVELDSHITLLYAQGKEIDRGRIVYDMKDILGDEYWDLVEKIQNPKEIPVLDVFELGSFENDSDYVVLKLKSESVIFEPLQKLNKGLRQRYDVSSDFDSYTPHVSLAELQPGCAAKYLASEDLKRFLQDTVISLEDFMISYGLSNEPEDRKQYFLTSFHSVDRYFRLIHLKSE